MMMRGRVVHAADQRTPAAARCHSRPAASQSNVWCTDSQAYGRHHRHSDKMCNSGESWSRTLRLLLLLLGNENSYDDRPNNTPLLPPRLAPQQLTFETR
jgi:hypothetical protein